ncbi:unnamed protein product [Ambrosiozyma monospora]|uniref:Unnamed protein product n=1 Tax=Ambrosiozyma monospora TaxID=43982 RepID=A0ACB5TSV4_AMBMO|nr:unnamed protein product [Ambrosiozyma monospora]
MFKYSIQSVDKPTKSSFKPKPKAASPATSGSVPKPKPTPKPFAPAKKPIVSEDDDGWGGEDEIEQRDFSKKPLENVPSAYKPTKVDINELRKGPSSTTSGPPKAKKAAPAAPKSPVSATISLTSTGLSSLPKPKVTNTVASRYATSEVATPPKFGGKAVNFDAAPKTDSSKLVGGASRNFASSSGKTPAQLWAEKKGKY